MFWRNKYSGRSRYFHKGKFETLPMFRKNRFVPMNYWYQSKKFVPLSSWPFLRGLRNNSARRKYIKGIYNTKGLRRFIARRRIKAKRYGY